MKATPPRIAYTVRQALETGAFSSGNKLYKAIARGDLETFLDGKRRMVSHRALEAYVTRCERATAAGKPSGEIPRPMSDESRAKLAEVNNALRPGSKSRRQAAG